jgi:hypothetical protein
MSRGKRLRVYRNYDINVVSLDWSFDLILGGLYLDEILMLTLMGLNEKHAVEASI